VLYLFFILRKKDAAIVVMPTEAGKTAVLMLTPYLLRKNKVLVVTTSKMVRGQIIEDLSSPNPKFMRWSIVIKMNFSCIGNE